MKKVVTLIISLLVICFILIVDHCFKRLSTNFDLLICQSVFSSGVIRYSIVCLLTPHDLTTT